LDLRNSGVKSCSPDLQCELSLQRISLSIFSRVENILVKNAMVLIRLNLNFELLCTTHTFDIGKNIYFIFLQRKELPSSFPLQCTEGRALRAAILIQWIRKGSVLSAAYIYYNIWLSCSFSLGSSHFCNRVEGMNINEIHNIRSNNKLFCYIWLLKICP
jgi:hypothetical protein